MFFFFFISKKVFNLNALLKLPLLLEALWLKKESDSFRKRIDVCEDGQYTVIFCNLSEQNPKHAVKAQMNLDVLDWEPNKPSHHADIYQQLVKRAK